MRRNHRSADDRRDGTGHRSGAHLVIQRTAGWLLLSAAIALGSRASIGAAESEPAAPAPSEYQVKAAFLFNFAKFVTWPAGAALGDHPALVVGVLGTDPFGSALDAAVRGRSVDGRSLVVRRFSSLDGLEACDVLFIGASERPRLRKILERLKNTPVLTIGEFEDFARDGGIIRLLTEDGRVRFEINVGAAAAARLTISSQLLALARLVQERDRRDP